MMVPKGADMSIWGIAGRVAVLSAVALLTASPTWAQLGPPGIPDPKCADTVVVQGTMVSFRYADEPIHAVVILRNNTQFARNFTLDLNDLQPIARTGPSVSGRIGGFSTENVVVGRMYPVRHFEVTTVYDMPSAAGANINVRNCSVN